MGMVKAGIVGGTGYTGGVARRYARAIHRPPKTSRRSDTLVVLSDLKFDLPETAGLAQAALVP